MTLGYMGSELLSRNFNIDVEELLEEDSRPIIEYLCENPQYQGLITIKYIQWNDAIDIDKDPMLCIRVDDNYLYDLEHSLEYVKEIHQEYLNIRQKLKDEVKSLVNTKYQKHYTRQILQSKINIHCVDSILKFV